MLSEIQQPWKAFLEELDQAVAADPTVVGTVDLRTPALSYGPSRMARSDTRPMDRDDPGTGRQPGHDDGSVNGTAVMMMIMMMMATISISTMRKQGDGAMTIATMSR
jgi:hypothetical protein